MFHKIKSVTPLPDYVLLAHFTDGTARRYDVKPLFARLDAFRALQDTPGLFEQAAADPGGYGVSWNDDLDLSSDEIWEHGAPTITPFDRLMAFSDATDLWGLSESTLRKAVSYRRLIEGVDVQKFGKQWVVTRDAMEREYGAPPSGLSQ